MIIALYTLTIGNDIYINIVLVNLLGRPTLLSVDLGLTAILLSICLSSSFRQLPSELAKRKSTKTNHMLGSKYDLKMHVRNLGYLLPCKLGSKNYFFRRLRNLTTTLTACMFGTKNVIHNQASVLEVTMSLLHRLKSQNVMNFGRQTA